MPAPTGDLIEVTLVGTQNEQEITYVSHWERVDASETAADIAQACATSFIVEILPNIAEEYVLTHINYRNLFDASEAGTVDISDQAGGRTAVDPLPPHDTVSVQLLHDEPQIRNGRKSFAGFAEDQQDNGVLTAATVSNMTTDATAWLTTTLKDIATGLVDTAKPVIVKRLSEVIGGVTKYKLPSSAAEALVGYIYDVVVSTYVRTQNSRKIGRGA